MGVGEVKAAGHIFLTLPCVAVTFSEFLHAVFIYFLLCPLLVSLVCLSVFFCQRSFFFLYK